MSLLILQRTLSLGCLWANKPDIVVLGKNTTECLIIDLACPFDRRVGGKTKEKIDKYQDLKREVQRLWKCREVKIVPVVIGALGTLPNDMWKWLTELDMASDIVLLQKACLLGSARILRKVLDT